MELSTKPAESQLASLAQEVVKLLSGGDIDQIADRFGYGLRYGRDSATAIRDDLRWCLSSLGASSLSPTRCGSVRTVQYFKPNTTNLAAAVSCVAYADNGAEVLISLVVFGPPDAGKYFVTLEDLYAPPAE